MRPSQKSSRARGRGGRKPNGNNVNRVYESAGPEGKVRGTPQQIIDKYLSLARDAQTSGDRVVSENFLQHAEHYQRILIEALGARAERRDNQFGDQDQPDYDMGDDGDGDGDAGDGQDAGPMPLARQADDERAGEGRQPDARQPEARQGDGRQGDGRPGEGRRRGGRPPRTTEVSGLTTIDSGDGDGGSLLVDAEEISASQPRRRRRSRNPEAMAVAAEPAEAEPQPE